MKKYAIHPGWINSRFDSDIHYISADRLANLYHLKPGNYIIWDIERPETYLGRDFKDYTHLYPRSDGDYSIK